MIDEKRGTRILCGVSLYRPLSPAYYAGSRSSVIISVAFLLPLIWHSCAAHLFAEFYTVPAAGIGSAPLRGRSLLLVPAIFFQTFQRTHREQQVLQGYSPLYPLVLALFVVALAFAPPSQSHRATLHMARNDNNDFLSFFFLC